MIYKRKNHTGKVIMLSLLLAGGAITYTVFATHSAKAVDDATAADLTASVPPALTDAVNKVNRIRLDSAFFNDTAYQSLQDFTTTLPQPVVGRANPFAPIGAVAAPVATASSTKAKTSSKSTKR